MHTSRTLLALCLLWSSAALAQPAPQPEASPEGEVSEQRRVEASTHFRRGVELFHEGAYRPALVEFQRAYDIAPDYRLLYNIGQTKLQTQDYVGAAQSYEAYLVAGGGEISPERRAQVEGALDSLRGRVGRVGFTVDREGADIFIDDVQVGTSPMHATVLANIGRHRVLARAADGAYASSIVEVAGGDVTEVKLTLAKPIASNKAAAGERPRVGAPQPRPWPLNRKIAVASWSLGGAALLGGAVVGALAKAEDKELDKLLTQPRINEDSTKSQRDSVRTLALSSDILLGVGAAAVITGTVLWLVDSGDRKPPERPRTTRRNVQLQVSATSLGVAGQF